MKNGHAALKKFQKDFTQHIRNPKRFKKPKQVSASRMNVYNSLLFNGIEDVISSCFPLCKKVLGKGKWLKLIRDFFTEHSCQSPFYREVPREFVTYLAGKTKSLQHIPFLPHLAHYEWLELDLFLSPEIPPAIHSKKKLGGKVIFNKPCKLVSYPYPVHQIKKGYKTPAETEPSFYFFYRNAQSEVDWLLLNSAQAKLIHFLLNQSLPFKKAVSKIAKELKLPQDFIFRAARESLEEFQRKAIILGWH